MVVGNKTAKVEIEKCHFCSFLIYLRLHYLIYMHMLEIYMLINCGNFLLLLIIAYFCLNM